MASMDRVEEQTVAAFIQQNFSDTQLDQDKIVAIAQHAMSCKEVDTKTNGLRILNAVHLGENPLSAMRAAVSTNDNTSVETICNTVYEKLKDTVVKTEWDFGKNTLFKEGAINEEQAKAIATIALQKMIPEYYEAYQKKSEVKENVSVEKPISLKAAALTIISNPHVQVATVTIVSIIAGRFFFSESCCDGSETFLTPYICNTSSGV